MSIIKDEISDETLDLNQAATFLKMSPSTLRSQIKSGKVKAAKPAKKWVFIKQDLVDLLRSLHNTGVEIPFCDSKIKEKQKCLYSNAVKRIGLVSQPQMDKEYAVQLGLETKLTRKNSTTSSK